MTAYWGAFLHGKSPRSDDGRPMPEQTAGPGKVLQLRTRSQGGNEITGNLRTVHQCDFWDAAS
jgi:hypothetical protein